MHDPMPVPRECSEHVVGNNTSLVLVESTSFSTEPSTPHWPQRHLFRAIHSRHTRQERSMKCNDFVHRSQVQIYRLGSFGFEGLENRWASEKNWWTIAILRHRIRPVIPASAVGL